MTNRPSIANSWADDFLKFVEWRGDYKFVSATDALKKKEGVISRDAFLNFMRTLPEEKFIGMIAFVSLQI